MKKETNQKYIVQSLQAETPDTNTIWLASANDKPLDYTAGQYITVFFPESGTPEGKAYSISSPPGEKFFSITVKKIGEFSGRLCVLKPGDTITASDPYGFFFPESTEIPLVLIAGGIGVAPFHSIINETEKTNPDRHITLLHSVRTQADKVFANHFKQLKSTLPNLKCQYFITQEPVIENDFQKNRRIVTNDLNGFKENESEYLICGSIPFTRDIWRTLRQSGVSEDLIYTEAFFSH